jgi:ATP-dependent protease ClpP protease subunit
MNTNPEILMYRRIFPIEGDITAKMLDEHRKNILIMATYGPKERIYFPIHTPGGDIRAMLHFNDFLNGLSILRTGIACGKCYSAGLGLLAECDIKLTLPHSDFYFHSLEAGNKILSLENEEKQKEATGGISRNGHENYIDVLSRGFDMTEDRVVELMTDGHRNNTKIFAPQAKELGIVTEIVAKFPWV